MDHEKIGKVSLNYQYYTGSDLYNEGDEAEELVLQTVKNSIDYKDHLDVILKDHRWPVLYQLSQQRQNIIKPMEIDSNDIVLEVGAGMGAVTGAIARRCKKVECIELSKRRSLANAYRNREYDNIEIYVANFQDVPLSRKYDVVTLIGVLEYAQSYIDSATPYEDFIEKIAGVLNQGGRIYIAIENKLGLKYFAGCSEDHLGKPFVGIEGYTKTDKVKTFSRSQLINLLVEHGFQEPYFYYPYPDYKFPTEIYSDDILPGENFQFVTTANYDMPRLKIFDEEKVIRSLAGAEELKMLANSFLVEAIRR